MLSISYLIKSTGGFILSNTPHPYGSFLCRFQSIWGNFWNLATLLWSCVLCLNMFDSVILKFTATPALPLLFMKIST
jgi:hypothetical protein